MPKMKLISEEAYIALNDLVRAVDEAEKAGLFDLDTSAASSVPHLYRHKVRASLSMAKMILAMDEIEEK